MATTILGIEEVELVAIAARNLARAQEFAKEFSIQRAYGNYDDLVKDEDADFESYYFTKE